jgi:DNA (cytosine-5)-methyltransferase 1
VSAPPYKLIDLFAGCGGMTRGFIDSGAFTPVFAVEMDPRAAATYALNFGDHVAVRPVEEVLEVPEADVVVGGPPCQGFSPLNMARVGLERRTLWAEYLRILDASGASVFLMENVPELLKSGEFAAFRQAVEQRGFTVRAEIVNAADYGVPQTRRRAFAVGVKTGEPPWPTETHTAPDRLSVFGLKPWRTFRWAVSNPTPLSATPDEKRWHRSRNPTAVSLERYRTIPGEGEGRFQLAERRPDITPRCWLEKPTGTTDVFGRLWWDKPAFTIRTEFYKPEKGRYLHPEEPRPITVREAARCMTFPDDFVLPEDQAMTAVAKQIGNAVPPLLARCFAVSIADHLSVRVARSAEGRKAA